MKVILLKDVQTVGRKYEVKEVAEGYALNFLFPQKMAEMATANSLKKVEERKKQTDADKAVQAELLMKNLEAINDINIAIEEKANEQGHLFASLHKEKIAEEVKKQAHVDIIPDFIQLDKPIKTTGDYEIVVEVNDKKATFKLSVAPLLSV